MQDTIMKLNNVFEQDLNKDTIAILLTHDTLILDIDANTHAHVHTHTQAF